MNDIRSNNLGAKVINYVKYINLEKSRYISFVSLDE